ncbi:MAG TPA: putative quinol monooxygenase [Burkholderiaceae bacterium]
MKKIPLHVAVHLHIQPGTQQLLRSTIEDVAVPTRAEPGCRYYALSRDTADENHFMLHEEWEDGAAFDLHLNSPHFHACQQKLAPIWARPPQIILLQPERA